MYNIDGFEVVEENFFDECDFLVCSELNFEYKGNEHRPSIESKSGGCYNPIKIGSIEAFNILLSEPCYFCKYKNAYLDKVVPILSVQDMFEYLEFFFLVEEPLFSEFTQNNKYFRETIVVNYDNMVNMYSLKSPIITCKTCFINKINAKNGIDTLFKMFTKKNEMASDKDLILKTADKGMRVRKSFLEESSNLLNQRPSSSSLTNLQAPKSKFPTFFEQLSEITLSVSNKTKLTLHKQDKRSESSIALQQLKQTEISSETLDNNYESNITSSSSVQPNKLINENQKDSYLGSQLEVCQENLISISQVLDNKFTHMNEDEHSFEKQLLLVNKINLICESLYNNSNVFSTLLTLKADFVIRLIKNIKSLLEMIHRNLISKSKIIKNHCFESMIHFKDDMMIIRKVNSIFEFMISKLKIDMTC